MACLAHFLGWQRSASSTHPILSFFLYPNQNKLFLFNPLFLSFFLFSFFFPWNKIYPFHPSIILCNPLKRSQTCLVLFLVAENMTANATVVMEKCKVQNLSCVVFPTTAQCSGIAMGGCMCKIINTLSNLIEV